jgi:K+-sensing histidine kinase KdpD
MNTASRHRATFKTLWLGLAFAAAILGTTRLTLAFGAIANATTAAFSFIILVLLAAFFGGLPVAITTSVVATLCFNYFYLPPVGAFHIAAFSDWISLAAFLLASVAISVLTAAAARNAARANALDRALAQLKELAAWLLSTPDDRLTLTGIAEAATRLFSLEYCSLHVYGEGKWRHFMGAAASDCSRETADGLLLKDHPAKLMDLVDENALGVRNIQINRGTTPLAMLTVRSTTLPTSVIAAMAHAIGVRLVGIMRDEQPHDTH